MSLICEVDGMSLSVSGKVLLDEVNLSLTSGDAVALVGESGAGKTLLSAALLGFAPHNALLEGEVKLFGKDVFKIKKKELASVRGRKASIIFQEPLTSLNPLMPIYKQIAEPLLIHKLAKAKQAKEKVLAALAEVGIDNPERKAFAFPHQLSGGERQRVLIAQALICEPELLIADEPTASLDPITKLQIVELLAAMTKKTGTALLMVTHEIKAASFLCEKIAVLHHGRIVESGDFAAVLSAPQADVTKSLLTEYF
jgi:ABC-type glutathione transport system ATPase component